MQLVSRTKQGHLQQLLTRTGERLSQSLRHHGHGHEIGDLELERLHRILLTRRRDEHRRWAFRRRQRAHERQPTHVVQYGAHQRNVRCEREGLARRGGVGIIPHHRQIQFGGEVGQLLRQRRRELTKNDDTKSHVDW